MINQHSLVPHEPGVITRDHDGSPCPTAVESRGPANAKLANTFSFVLGRFHTTTAPSSVSTNGLYSLDLIKVVYNQHSNVSRPHAYHSAHTCCPLSWD